MKERPKNRFISDKGISTLEMLIALSIIIIALSSVSVIVFGGQLLLVDSQTNDEALYKAKSELEQALSQNFYILDSKSPFNDDIYTKELRVDWIDEYIKKIISRATWNIGSRPQKIELATIITNPEGSIRGDTCNPQITGDWSDPQILGFGDFSSPEGATDIDSRLKKVYLTTNPSAANKPDFYIFDVSDPNPASHQLPQLSSLNTGNGLEAVKISGNYAYVANRSINAQLQIIDISNPQNPSVIRNFKIPGVTGSGYGKSIFYKNGFVYLGLYKTAGPEFNIIDVSDPLNPVYRGGWEVNARVNAIHIKDNIAYLATPAPDPPTPKKENLSVLDISDPSNIVRINTFSTAIAETQSGQSIFLDGNKLYFGRAVGGVDNVNNHELFILDVSDPYNIIMLGSKNIGATVNAMTLRGGRLFMLTGEPNLGFQIWDVGNPANITLYSSKNIQQTSTGGMDCEGNIIYVAQRSGHALQIIGPK